MLMPGTDTLVWSKRLRPSAVISVHTLGSSASGSGDHFTIDALDLGDTLNDKWGVHLLVVVSSPIAVNWVAKQENVLELWQLS